jgi:thiol-disulfide isomerase/thioredoxin
MGRKLAGYASAAAVFALAGLPVHAQEVGLALGSVPAAVEIEDLNGQVVRLSDYVGRKPVIIQFWATWCPTCAATLPALRAARQRHGDAIEVLFIAVGVNQTPRSIRRHLETNALPGRVLYDARGRAARAYRVPTTSYIVILDAAGRVVYTGVGADQDIAAAVARALR